MVLEQNFVLGIKETSLHSKEISHMHKNIDQPSITTACLTASRIWTPWNHAATIAHSYVKDPQAKKAVPLQSQICANRVFA